MVNIRYSFNGLFYKWFEIMMSCAGSLLILIIDHGLCNVLINLLKQCTRVFMPSPSAQVISHSAFQLMFTLVPRGLWHWSIAIFIHSHVSSRVPTDAYLMRYLSTSAALQKNQVDCLSIYNFHIKINCWVCFNFTRGINTITRIAHASPYSNPLPKLLQF